MSKLFGNVDRFAPNGALSGWIVDQDAPAGPPSVTLLLGGESVAVFRPEGERPDVVAAGYQPLVCGFTVRVPGKFLDGQSREIAFRAADGAVTRIGGIAAVLQARSIEGFAELSPDRTRVTGWAVDPASPGRQLFADILIDGRPVKTVSCARVPKVTKPTASGELSVGTFDVPLASYIADGLGSQEVTVIVSGQTTPLPGGPLMAPRAGMRENRLEDITSGRLAGWSLDPATNKGLPVRIYCDGVLVSELPADGFRTNLAKTFGAQEGGFFFELPEALYDGVNHVVSAVGHGDFELAGSPRLLTYEQQVLHQTAGGLRANNTTGDAREIGYLAGDLNWLLDQAKLAQPAREVAQALTIDLTHHAVFSKPPTTAFDLVKGYLQSNTLNYDDPGIAAALVDMIKGMTPKARVALNTILATPAHRARPYRAALVAAVQFAGGGAETATSILFNICSRARVSDAMVRFCAEMLLQQGMADEAKDLVFFSVVGKADA